MNILEVGHFKKYFVNIDNNDNFLGNYPNDMTTPIYASTILS